MLERYSLYMLEALMIKAVPELPGNLLGFEVSGTVSANDYETVIIPAVDAAVAEDRKLRLLYQVTPEFEKFDFGAIWEDARVGLQHYTSWDRIAVVTDVSWLRSAVSAFGFMVPGQVRLFDNDQIEDAKNWLVE